MVVGALAPTTALYRVAPACNGWRVVAEMQKMERRWSRASSHFPCSFLTVQDKVGIPSDHVDSMLAFFRTIDSGAPQQPEQQQQQQRSQRSVALGVGSAVQGQGVQPLGLTTEQVRGIHAFGHVHGMHVRLGLAVLMGLEAGAGGGVLAFRR